MITKVLYCSRSGNTEKLAQAIANGISNKAEKIESGTKIDKVDILFIGGALYAGNLDQTLRDFLTSLEKTQVKEVVLFGTSAGKKTIMPQVCAFLEPKQIKVHENEFHCKGAFLFVHKGHPGADDLEKAEQFAKKALADIRRQMN